MEHITSAWLQQWGAPAFCSALPNREDLFPALAQEGQCFWQTRNAHGRLQFQTAALTLQQGNTYSKCCQRGPTYCTHWDCETEGQEAGEGCETEGWCWNSYRNTCPCCWSPQSHPLPWEGLMDPSHTKGTHCGATWPAWGRGEGCCSSWGTARSFVLGNVAGITLHQWAWTGVGSSSGFPQVLTLQIRVGKVRRHMWNTLIQTDYFLVCQTGTSLGPAICH